MKEACARPADVSASLTSILSRYALCLNEEGEEQSRCIHSARLHSDEPTQRIGRGTTATIAEMAVGRAGQGTEGGSMSVEFEGEKRRVYMMHAPLLCRSVFVCHIGCSSQSRKGHPKQTVQTVRSVR